MTDGREHVQRDHAGQRDDPCSAEQDGSGSHPTTQSNMQLKTYEQFISGIFFLTYLGRS